MYQLSRSLYRDLGSMLSNAAGQPDRAHLLESCERAMRRLVLEPGSPDPAQSLFREVRHLFAADAQAEVRALIRLHVQAGRGLGTRLEGMLREAASPRPARRAASTFPV